MLFERMKDKYKLHDCSAGNRFTVLVTRLCKIQMWKFQQCYVIRLTGQVAMVRPGVGIVQHLLLTGVHIH